LANRIAEQLFNPRVEVAGLVGEPEPPEEDEFGNPMAWIKDPFLPKDITQLREATRLGGGEFLNLILDFSEGLTAANRTDLPEPIDPDTTGV
jgi:hypothetical protein